MGTMMQGLSPELILDIMKRKAEGQQGDFSTLAGLDQPESMAPGQPRDITGSTLESMNKLLNAREEYVRQQRSKHKILAPIIDILGAGTKRGTFTQRQRTRFDETYGTAQKDIQQQNAADRIEEMRRMAEVKDRTARLAVTQRDIASRREQATKLYHEQINKAIADRSAALKDRELDIKTRLADSRITLEERKGLESEMEAFAKEREALAGNLTKLSYTVSDKLQKGDFAGASADLNAFNEGNKAIASGKIFSLGSKMTPTEDPKSGVRTNTTVRNLVRPDAPNVNNIMPGAQPGQAPQQAAPGQAQPQAQPQQTPPQDAAPTTMTTPGGPRVSKPGNAQGLAPSTLGNEAPTPSQKSDRPWDLPKTQYMIGIRKNLYASQHLMGHATGVINSILEMAGDPAQRQSTLGRILGGSKPGQSFRGALGTFFGDPVKFDQAKFIRESLDSLFQKAKANLSGTRMTQAEIFAHVLSLARPTDDDEAVLAKMSGLHMLAQIDNFLMKHQELNRALDDPNYQQRMFKKIGNAYRRYTEQLVTATKSLRKGGKVALPEIPNVSDIFQGRETMRFKSTNTGTSEPYADRLMRAITKGK